MSTPITFYIFQKASELDLINLWRLFAVFVILYFTLSHYWKWRQYHYLAWKLPGPLCLPIVRHAHLLIGKSTGGIIELFLKYANKCKRTFKLWLGPELVVVICKPEDAKILLWSRYTFSKSYVYKMLKIFAGEGLFTNNDGKKLG